FTGLTGCTGYGSGRTSILNILSKPFLVLIKVGFARNVIASLSHRIVKTGIGIASLSDGIYFLCNGINKISDRIARKSYRIARKSYRIMGKSDRITRKSN